MKEGVVMNSSGGDATKILFRVDGNHVKLHKNGIYLGTFIVPDGHIDIEENATITGALYGDKVQLKKNVNLIAAPAVQLYVDLFIAP